MKMGVKKIGAYILGSVMAFSLLSVCGGTADSAAVRDEQAVPPAAAEAPVVASGDCGDDGSNLTWSLSGDGVLTISGSGRMEDYSHPQFAPQTSFDEWQMWDAAPWLYYDICTGADGQPLCQIRQADIGKGVTYVGEFAFTCSHVQSVTLPEGLTDIGAGGDDSYTLGDPAYTVISGYPGSAAEAFAQKWGYTFQPLDEAAVQSQALPADGALQQPSEGTALTVIADQVNIRSGPGSEYESLGTVNIGTSLTATGKSDNWYQVGYNGSIGYIIQNFVTETAALEGDWSGVIGSLAERYGVMSTAEMSMVNDWTSPTVWQGSDLTGLLSATALDLDADGQQELFTVRLDNYGEDLSGYGNYTDTTHLYLAVYEPGGSEPTAERMFYLLSDVVGSQGANSQFTVFTYDYDGVRYICLDNHVTMNETRTLVEFFTYDGSQLIFAGAAEYEEYGQGDVCVYRADTEPVSFRDFVEIPALNKCAAWQTVMSFSIEAANWQGLTHEESRPILGPMRTSWPGASSWQTTTNACGSTRPASRRSITS